MLATALLFTTSIDANLPWFTQHIEYSTEHIWLSVPLQEASLALQLRYVAKVKIKVYSPERLVFRWKWFSVKLKKHTQP